MNKNEYYFVDRLIETKEVVDLKRYVVELSQEEIEEKIVMYNNPKSGPREHVQIFDQDTIEIIKLALKWRNNTTLGDILSELEAMEQEIYGLRGELSCYMRGQE